jgi:hypothetical protein
MAALAGDYSATLRWAKIQAGAAVAAWSTAQAATAQAAAAHRADAAQASARGEPPPAFIDPGEACRQDASAVLERARSQLAGAGDAIAVQVDIEADAAPVEQGWLSSVADEAGRVGSDVLSSLASVGNAVVQHPEDLAGLIGGVGLTAISGIGDGAGLLLDATGVGAVAGVPLNVVSTAGVVAGSALVAASVGDLANHAATDSRAEKPRIEAPRPTRTDRYKEHLKPSDLEGARRELNGEVVARKSGGAPYDHVTEVREAQDGLVKRINRLKRQLGDSRLAQADRPPIEAELSEASRLLDHSEQWVPRD